MTKIILFPLVDEDVALFENWLYLPHVAKWYHHPKDWLEEVKNRKNDFSFINHFIAKSEDMPIGFCQYYEYSKSGEDWYDNNILDGIYSIDYMIGNPTFLGKGFGKEIISLLIEKIKFHPNAKRIIVQPEQENKASCNSLLSCGFCFDNENKIYKLDI